MNARRWPLWLLAAIPLYMSWTFGHSLWNPDETRDAGMAAEMYRSGGWAVPTLNGDAFLEKPPLYYWAASIVYKLTGRVTAGTTRLPSALFGLAGVLFTFLIGRRFFNDRAAFFAAAMLATANQYFRMSHFSTMDVALAAMVAGSLYFYARENLWGFALFTMLAFFAKGFLGVLLPGMVVTVDLLIKRDFLKLGKYVGVGAIGFAILGLPWLWALYKHGGNEYLKIFLIDNHWHRFSSGAADHATNPVYMYFLSFPADFMPWSLVAITAFVALIGNWRAQWASPTLRLLILWFGLMLLFFTVSSGKRSIYFLPAFPAAALLAGDWLDRFVADDARRSRFEIVMFYSTAVLVLVAAGALWSADLYMNHSVLGFVVGAALFVPLSAILIRSLKTRVWERAAVSAVALFAATVAFGSLGLEKAMDRDKTFEPVCDVLKQERSGRTVAGYDLSEMERGVFSFCLQSNLKNILTVEELHAVLDAPEPIVLVANRNKLTYIGPIVDSRMQQRFVYRADKKTRSYLIYESPDR